MSLLTGHVEPLESVGCCRQHLDVQLMYNASLELARGEALTRNAFPAKKVRCDSSFNVSGLVVRLNCAVQRIACECKMISWEIKRTHVFVSHPMWFLISCDMSTCCLFLYKFSLAHPRPPFFTQTSQTQSLALTSNAFPS